MELNAGNGYFTPIVTCHLVALPYVAKVHNALHCFRSLLQLRNHQDFYHHHFGDDYDISIKVDSSRLRNAAGTEKKTT
jgi:hypothetical protein